MKKFEQDMQELIDSFKEKLKRASDEVISEFYCDVTPYAETDSFTNFRNEVLQSIISSEPNEWDYRQREIRALILKEHRDELVPLLNKELLSEVERLKQIIEGYQGSHYSRY